MNKISTRHIKLTIMLAMLMVASAAMAQRAGGPEPPSADPKVIVGGSVYGGGNLANVGGNTSVTINQVGSQVGVDVYGGGALADVGASTTNTTTVTLSNGKVLGDVYGGGLGDNTTPAMVNGNVEVVVNNGSVSVGGSVFGCNNVNGTPLGTVTVTINGSASSTITEGVKNYAIGGVYGGGNQAHYVPTTITKGYPSVTINGCSTSIANVYGGGKAAGVSQTNVIINGGDIGRAFAGGDGNNALNTPAHVGYDNTDANPADPSSVSTYPTPTPENGVGEANISVRGGTIGQLFGGSNKNGVIRTSNSVEVDKSLASGSSCLMKIGEVYGGGNEADGNAGAITIGCTGTLVALGEGEHYGIDQEGICYVYGGANQADIGTLANHSDITLDINSGIVENVFGGNNTSGDIYGTIQVNIEKTGSCDWYVGNVYGGGNRAPYGGVPDVNIINGTVSRSVYGGGNEAGVSGGDVAMTGGQVLGGIYGGCNTSGVVGGDIAVNISGGTVGTSATNRANVFGGGYGAGTSTTGNVDVTITRADGENPPAAPTIYGDVYGGSALGSVNTDGSNTTTVSILDGTLVSDVGTDANGFPVYNGGNVFGGGLGDASDDNKGKVNGVVTVNIGSGDVASTGFTTTDNTGNATIGGNVYGCNNTNGSPQQNVTVNIFKTAHTLTDTYDYNPSTNGNIPATFAIQNVFGGGNKADFRVSGKSATVNIYGCDNTIGRTFGGGNAAATNTVTTMIQGGRFNEAYAGGNGEVSAANIFGNANLYIHGGSVVFSFAGSNQNGLITGTSLVTMDNEGGCGNIMIEEHFCGNNFSNYYGNIEAVIECPGLHVKNLYGGCKQAHVLKYPTAAEINASPNSFPGVMDLYNEHQSTWDLEYAGTGGNIHLTVKGGDYLNIYGGSQGTETTPANIDGNITLDVFGGTVRNAIYGGSHINGSVGGNIIVNVENKHNEGCELEADIADVYGGGNKADYNTTDHTEHDYPQVNIKNAAVKNVFGGGLEAQVTGNPQIKIKKGADVHENVYGGGNMGEVHGDTKVIINGKME